MRMILTLVLLAWWPVSAYAAPQAETPEMGEGSMLVSEPGRAQLTRIVVVSARVEAIDAATRTLILATPNERSLEYVADEEVRNFERIEVGDMVEATVLHMLQLERVDEGADGTPDRTDASARAEPGEKPRAAVGTRVTFMNDVVRVDRAANLISLRDPEGHVVDFDVQNPAQFDALRVGDKVRATYTEAVAVEVRAAE